MSDSDKKDTAEGLGILGAAGGAVGTAQLLYRPSKMEDKLDAAVDRMTEAKKALEKKVTNGATGGELPTPKEAARNADLLHANTRYERASKGYTDAVKSITPKQSGREVKNALKPAFNEFADAEKQVLKAEGNAYFGKLGGVRDSVGPEVANFRAARHEVASLAKIESANARSGLMAALKRPFTMLRHGDGKAALAVIGGTVLAGGLIYVGARVAQGVSDTKAKMGSFAEREQMRQTAAAAVDPAARTV